MFNPLIPSPRMRTSNWDSKYLWSTSDPRCSAPLWSVVKRTQRTPKKKGWTQGTQSQRCRTVKMNPARPTWSSHEALSASVFSSLAVEKSTIFIHISTAHHPGNISHGAQKIASAPPPQLLWENGCLTPEIWNRRRAHDYFAPEQHRKIQQIMKERRQGGQKKIVKKCPST